MAARILSADLVQRMGLDHAPALSRFEVTTASTPRLHGRRREQSLLLIFTNASSKCQRHWMKPRVCATRLLLGEHWAKPIPPEPDRLVANVDPALGQEILDVAQRQRKHRNGRSSSETTRPGAGRKSSLTPSFPSSAFSLQIEEWTDFAALPQLTLPSSRTDSQRAAWTLCHPRRDHERIGPFLLLLK
jgi:hypothetical protein